MGLIRKCQWGVDLRLILEWSLIDPGVVRVQEMTKNLLDIMGDESEAGGAAKGAGESARKAAEEGRGGRHGGNSNVMSMAMQQREIMQGRAAEASISASGGGGGGGGMGGSPELHNPGHVGNSANINALQVPPKQNPP